VNESFRQFSAPVPLWGVMGDLIDLAERRADRSRPTVGARPAFFFDLACPFSYLAAERVERVLGEVDWVPTSASLLAPGLGRGETAAVRAHAETCAVALRLPLVWPDRFPADAPGALRAAAYAVEIGAGARFALAASRLAFCGGFDLEDPEILAEAAAAAGIGLRECLTAVGDPSRDEPLQATAQGLVAHGVRRVPAIRVGTRWFDGDGVLASAAAFLRAAPAFDRPFAS
jgi:2-hydroxychromene-2-carboxylate isomerase